MVTEREVFCVDECRKRSDSLFCSPSVGFLRSNTIQVVLIGRQKGENETGVCGVFRARM